MSALLGPELEYGKSVDIRVQDGIFTKVANHIDDNGIRNENILDGSGLLAIPGFINCHTHIGDSIAKDVSLGLDVKGSVHPVFGVKTQVLNKTQPSHLGQFIRNSCVSMLAGGTTTFVDFREGGPKGVSLLRRVCDAEPIRGIILGRVDKYQNPSQIKNDTVPPGLQEDIDDIVSQADGIGISGANENGDSVLRLYSKASKIRAIHAAETSSTVAESYEMSGRGEVERALLIKPHFLVHMVSASRTELRRVANAKIGVVSCPRANAVLGGSIPDISKMVSAGCTVGLGTDNVMVNPPDMFGEMEFAWKTSGGRLSPRDVLRMATVNGGRILNKRLGVISAGYVADYILIEKHHIDMEPMHNPYAALVHRAGANSIRAVSVGGSIVHGKV